MCSSSQNSRAMGRPSSTCPTPFRANARVYGGAASSATRVASHHYTALLFRLLLMLLMKLSTARRKRCRTLGRGVVTAERKQCECDAASRRSTTGEPLARPRRPSTDDVAVVYEEPTRQPSLSTSSHHHHHRSQRQPQ